MLRLKEIREKKGLTQAQVADAMGIHLTNYNKLENGGTEMTLSKMEQLAHILHVQPADLISIQNQVRTVIVKQHIQAGYWNESNDWPEDDWYDVAVPDDAQFRGINLYGAELRGPSMNRRYPDRAALVYTDMQETHEQPKVGRRYIVEVERSDGMRESTVKTLWQDESGKFWLLPESSDPRYQTPIDPSGEEGDTVRIVGPVVFAVQREY